MEKICKEILKQSINDCKRLLAFNKTQFEF